MQSPKEVDSKNHFKNLGENYLRSKYATGEDMRRNDICASKSERLTH